MKWTNFFLTLFLVLAVSSQSFGMCGNCGKKDGSSKMMDTYNVPWVDIDKDSDKSLSWDEFKSRFGEEKRSGFDGIDADKSGSISQDEWIKFKDAHKMMGHKMMDCKMKDHKMSPQSEDHSAH